MGEKVKEVLRKQVKKTKSYISKKDKKMRGWIQKTKHATSGISRKRNRQMARKKTSKTCYIKTSRTEGHGSIRLELGNKLRKALSWTLPLCQVLQGRKDWKARTFQLFRRPERNKTTGGIEFTFSTAGCIGPSATPGLGVWWIWPLLALTLASFSTRRGFSALTGLREACLAASRCSIHGIH